MPSSPPALRARSLPTALGLALIALASSAAADVPSDLDAVVVTATRTARTQDDTLAAVTVIDRAQLEQLQARSLPDVLRALPGVSLTNNGGPGKATSLFLRGTESDHVLVLVDGLKLGSATNGAAALQELPVEQIERIEVVRGPFSSLYGSEALGGVIQVFTRQPADGVAPNASFGFGSFDTLRAGAGLGARRGDAWFAAQAAHEQTEGIDAYRGNPARNEAHLDPDLDGYRSRSLSLRAGTRLGDAWTLEGHGMRADGRNEYDGSLNNLADTVQQVAGARVRYSGGERVAVTLTAGRAMDRNTAYQHRVFSSRFDTARDQAGLQADLALGAGLLSAGTDWLRDEIDSSTAYVDDASGLPIESRITRGAFAQWQQEAGAHAWQAGLRHDDNSQFGGHTTGSLLWGWTLRPSLRATASAGTAYKAPTFNELYYPGYGNSRLQPETSRSVELGLRGTPSWGDWRVQAFETRVEDLIAFDASIGPNGAANNIDRARLRGVEAGLDLQLAGWQIGPQFTWLDPRNQSRAYPDRILPRRARQSARLDLQRRLGAVSLGATAAGFGPRYDDVANSRRLHGYALLDLRATWHMAPGWEAQFAVENAFDRRYETAAFYRQPGRGYFFTLRYRRSP